MAPSGSHGTVSATSVTSAVVARRTSQPTNPVTITPTTSAAAPTRPASQCHTSHLLAGGAQQLRHLHLAAALRGADQDRIHDRDAGVEAGRSEQHPEAEVVGVTPGPASLRVGVGHGRQSLDCDIQRTKGAPVTHEDIVCDRRVRLIEHAAKIGDVTEACQVFGVSRKTYYEWLKKAEHDGLSALLPKDRRKPHQPNAMSSEEVAVILSEAVTRPTLGPKALLRHLRPWRR